MAIDDPEHEFFGFLALDDEAILNTEFQTFTFDLPSATSLDLRIEVFTNDGAERVGIDNIRVVGEGAVLPGDYDGDQQLTAVDIDLLSVAVGTNDLKFDANGDGAVNSNDRTEWIVNLKGTWFGDANLDGEFNSSDFVQVFQAGEYEDAIAGNSSWSTGDWNGDGDFSSSDFVVAFQDGGFELGPRGIHQVPEPDAPAYLIAGLVFLAIRRRK